MKPAHLSKVMFKMRQSLPHISNSKAPDTRQDSGPQSGNLASHPDSEPSEELWRVKLSSPPLEQDSEGK